MGTSASRGSTGGILGQIKNKPSRYTGGINPLPTDPAVSEIIDQTQSQQRQQASRGRASTMLTGGLGLLDNPYTSRKILLGF